MILLPTHLTNSKASVNFANGKHEVLKTRMLGSDIERLLFASLTLGTGVMIQTFDHGMVYVESLK
jgi:hypothetical protein